jgi:CheY-like chemotaxis protein
VVDDEPDSVDLYEEYLRGAGWDVGAAQTGDEALVIAPVYLPDVIVMDLCMPGLDGFQTMLRLKVDPRTARIPIVVLTGLAEGRSAKRAMRVGARFVLIKPCTADELRAVMEASIPSSRSDPPNPHGG